MNKEFILEEFLKLVKNDLKKDKHSNDVLNYSTPEELSDKIDLSIAEDSLNEKSFIATIDDYIKYSVDTSNPQFANQLWSGRSFPGMIGEFLTALTNTSIYTYETAPLATLIEKEMINLMGNFAGYENPGGTFLTGGSNANLVSMLVARNTMYPDIKANGNVNNLKFTIFVSERCHYSFDKAANVMGLGENNVINVKCNDNFEMDVEDLDKKIQESIDRGETPYYVAATGGTTETGAFDPIKSIKNVTDKYNLWLHLDAAWGGSLFLSDKHKSLLDGSELTDSIAWDAHKMMGLPLICSVLLLKNKEHLYPAVKAAGTDYIFHDYDHAEYDLGRSSIQCGRRVDSLKLWLAFKYFGIKGFRKRIDRIMELSQYLTTKIINDTDFELLAPTAFANINFRFIDSNLSEKELNQLNFDARDEIYKSGKALFNYCFLHEKLSIRYIIANDEVTENDLDLFLDLYKDECRKQLELKVNV